MDADIARSQLAAALVRVAGGDRAALRLVYKDTSAKLLGVCLRILNDRAEAEDVLQDAARLAAWARWERQADIVPRRPDVAAMFDPATSRTGENTDPNA